ncbi:MAG: CmpA/NrtA family ABC transporter substrate-binding protein [Pirellulales bacterium]
MSKSLSLPLWMGCRLLSFVLPMLASVMLLGCGTSSVPVASPAGTTDVSNRSPISSDAVPAVAGTKQLLAVEKDEIKLGFIKLTDCVPLVIAKEKGFFGEEGLNVTLEAQANWKVLLDRVISGELDGAHMLAGQPIASTIGIGTKAHVITACSLDLNGNAITVSNRVWKMMQEASPELNSETPSHPISAAALKPVIEKYKMEGKPFNLGMVFPVSTHNYELRYWLAAGGIHPGLYTASDTRGLDQGDVVISVTPPPQMPATLEAGTIEGYCVGEPWNQQAVAKGIGVPVVTDSEIWRNNPEKVLGVTADWNEKNPQTHIALVKAIIRACKWLDETDESGKLVNRMEAAQILSQKEYVGADVEVIANSMTGYFYFQKSDKRPMPDFNVFFRHDATYPFYSDCVWYLTQMRRWGQIGESKSDEWYHETAKSIYRPDIYKQAAEGLVAEGFLKPDEIPATDGYKGPTKEFIDGIEYDGKRPLDYLKSLTIGNKD